MRNSFTLIMPSAVFCGEDSLDNLDELLKGVNKVVIFTDQIIRSAGLLDRLLQKVNNLQIQSVTIDDLATEPTVYQANKVIERFRSEGADLIIAVGGGSVMDMAKLCSILNTDYYTIFDLL